MVVLVGVGLFVFSQWMGRRGNPPIILISIDTCRADYLSCYRPDRETTPNIDALAGHATLFERVVSPVPITLPSHSSMLTGLIPPMHGVRNQPGFALPDAARTIPEVLGDHGYTTGAIVSAYVLNEGFGLGQGFEIYDDDFQASRSHGWGNERVGDETSAVAIEWLREHADERFFLFLHYYDPHLPYEAPEPFATQFPDDAYAAEIAYVDHCIGKVLDELKALEIYDESLIIITADHGEMLGEHGEESHQFFVYESAIKVPLLIKLPGQQTARRVEDVVGLVDIAPTVYALTNAQKPWTNGQDLSAKLDGPASGKGIAAGEATRYLYSESTMPLAYGANPVMAQVGRQWKYIHSTRPELYDLVADPAEAVNLAAEQPHRARDMQLRISEALKGNSGAAQGETAVSAEQRERLESLGYAGVSSAGGEAVFDPDREDAKDLIDVHVAFTRTLEADPAEAEELVRQFLDKWPNTRVFRLSLGRLLKKQERYDEAIEQFSALIGFLPEEGVAYVERGLAREQVGDVDGAKADLTKAQELLPPSSPWNARCQAALRRLAARSESP